MASLIVVSNSARQDEASKPCNLYRFHTQLSLKGELNVP